MALSEQQKGELFVASSASLGGFFPIVVVLTYASISGFASLAWSTLIAAVFFGVLLVYRRKLSELKNLLVWKHCVFVALFIGIAFYSLYFIGLKYTTPGNASIIVLLQVLVAFLFFNVYRGEYISNESKLGAVLMLAGAFVLLGENFSVVNIGDFIILASVVFAPIGNYFQQEARKLASSETVMFLRSLISVPVLFLVMYVLGASAAMSDLRIALPFLILNGLVLLGVEKMLWIEGIHRISVTKATALVCVTPLVTLIFAWALLQQVPTVWQLLSLVPFTFGVLFLTDQIRLSRMT